MILIIAAVPALAQPPDTLHVSSWKLCRLNMKAGSLLGTTWTRIDFDSMALARFLSFQMVRRDASGRVRVQLPGLGVLILESVVLGRSEEEIAELFRQRYRPDTVRGMNRQLMEGMSYHVLRRHPNLERLDSALGYDPDLLRLYVEWGRSTWESRDRIYRAPRTDGSDTLIIKTNEYGDSVRFTDFDVVENTDAIALAISADGKMREVVIAVDEMTGEWSHASDSTAVRAWIQKAGLTSPRIYAEPENLSSLFFGREMPLIRAFIALFPSNSEDVPYQDLLSHMFYFLNRDSAAAADIVFSKGGKDFLSEGKRYLCTRFPEFDCEYDFDFTDTAAWRAAGVALYDALPRFRRMMIRHYVVAVGDSVVAVVTFDQHGEGKEPTIRTLADLEEWLEIFGEDDEEPLHRLEEWLELSTHPFRLPSPRHGLLYSVRGEPCGTWGRVSIGE